MIAKRLVRYLRRFAVRNLARMSMLLHKPRRIALVYGAPDYEENSLVTALRLSQRYKGQIVLICQSPARTAQYLSTVSKVIGGNPTAINYVAMNRWKVLWSYYGPAELVFYTHGMFFSPKSIGKRLHINLWHGTGPKLASNKNFKSAFDADALSSASPVWGVSTAKSLRMSNQRVISGNARADLLERSDQTRTKLGWNEKVVLWLPTYRRSTEVSIGTLAEGKTFVSEHAVELSKHAAAHNIRLIAKPHPFDAEQLTDLGIEVITNTEIWDKEITNSQLIAAADGAISDYSSAWVDALIADVPVALYCPDLAKYVADRGFNQPTMDQVAKDLFIDAASMNEFFHAISQGQAFRAAAQTQLKETLKLSAGQRADQMLDQVRDLAQSLKNFKIDL